MLSRFRNQHRNVDALRFVCMVAPMKDEICPTCGRKITVKRKRRAEVVRLRKAGKTWVEIGEALSVSPQAALQMHKRAEKAAPQ